MKKSRLFEDIQENYDTSGSPLLVDDSGSLDDFEKTVVEYRQANPLVWEFHDPNLTSDYVEVVEFLHKYPAELEYLLAIWRAEGSSLVNFDREDRRSFLDVCFDDLGISVSSPEYLHKLSWTLFRYGTSVQIDIRRVLDFAVLRKHTTISAAHLPEYVRACVDLELLHLHMQRRKQGAPKLADDASHPTLTDVSVCKESRTISRLHFNIPVSLKNSPRLWETFLVFFEAGDEDAPKQEWEDALTRAGAEWEARRQARNDLKIKLKSLGLTVPHGGRRIVEDAESIRHFSKT